MSRRPSVARRESAKAQSVQVETAQPPVELSSLVPLLLLFAASGCSALIYEIVWFQLLQLVIGSSAISLGLLLAAYMGGLCLGSALFARVIAARLHPMRVYALLELGIGILGVLALFGVPLVARIYVAGSTTGVLGIVGRGVIAAVCLLPPTILMGASLPAIGRSVRTTPQGVSWLGLLYSANIAGAVMGSVLGGFYLLRVYDLGVATYTAAGINLAVAALAFLLATRTHHEPEVSSETGPAQRTAGAPLVYLVIGLSGLAALGAEVVWTRLLSLLLGATVYTFSIILAVFLIGLWAGSGLGSLLARRTKGVLSHPIAALAVCQILLAAAIAWTAFCIARVLPYWPVDPWLSIGPWFNFDLDFVRCLHTIFPAALLWGASFPFALASIATEGEDPARLAGSVYAVNTLGSIVGALAFSLVLIPAIGTRGSQQLLIWLAAAGAAVALFAALKNCLYSVTKSAAAIVATALVTLVLAGSVSPLPWQAIAYGRRIAAILSGLNAPMDQQTKPLFVGEGINSSVVITERRDQRFFYVSGKSEASTALLDMRLQRMMGHIPALIHPGPRSVLVVGFGAGVTAGSFVTYPEVGSIVICELESMIPPASDEFFGKENYHVLRDSRTHVVNDDARHFILTTPDRFDVITTDPIHPWVKGTSTLYSKEYYELAKSHLNPGGVVAQWLPIYESDEETVRTELATFFSVFPDATVWSNYLQGDGYDLVLLGRTDPSPISIDALQARLSQSAYAPVAASLADAAFHSATDLLATYAGRASDLQPLVAGVELNNDLNLRLQYLAGLGLNSRRSAEIYRELLSYRRFPDDLLTGAGERIDPLKTLFGRPARTF